MHYRRLSKWDRQVSSNALKSVLNTASMLSRYMPVMQLRKEN